jgi:hypothetical protein
MGLLCVHHLTVRVQVQYISTMAGALTLEKAAAGRAPDGLSVASPHVHGLTIIRALIQVSGVREARCVCVCVLCFVCVSVSVTPLTHSHSHSNPTPTATVRQDVQEATGRGTRGAADCHLNDQERSNRRCPLRR